MPGDTLMVLGAGVHQVPLIRRATELGCRVVTADYLPGNVGHRLAHASVDVSTTDVEGVVGHARRLDVDGVVTVASDVAVPAAAAAARALGLPGPSPEAAATLCDKAAFRALQHRHGLPAPGFAAVRTADEAVAAAGRLMPPLVCKPADTSGSRGITLLAEPTRAAVEAAFTAAAGHARSGVVCLEEYVEGTDVSGDGFLRGGRLLAVITSKRSRGFVVTGHALPTTLDAAARDQVTAAVEAAAAAAGYTDGPVDFDVRRSPERAVVIEMSPRLGGNGIPALAGHGTDADLLAAAVCAALARPIDLPDAASVRRPCGSLILGADAPGVLAGIADRAVLRAAAPEVFDLALTVDVGQAVPAHTHGGASLGHVLFDIPDGSTWDDVAARVRAGLAVRLEPPPGS